MLFSHSQHLFFHPRSLFAYNMYSSTLPTVRYLELAERIRMDHIAEPAIPARHEPVTLELRGASRELSFESAATHDTEAEANWGFITTVVDQTKDSESSESLELLDSESSEPISISSEDDDPFEPSTRPSSPHYEALEASDMEPFPEYFDARNSYLFDDPNLDFVGDTNLSARETHCVKHCQHLACHTTVKIDADKGIDRACTCGDYKFVPKPLDAATTFFIAQVPAPYPYDPCATITISLPTATALLHRLEATGKLSIHQFLLRAPGYTTSTVRNHGRVAFAAKNAEVTILKGVERTLERMLDAMPNEACDIEIAELEAKLLHCVRWDCIKWVGQWIWGGNPKGYSIDLLRGEMCKKEGVKILVDRAVEITQVVVGALVWWAHVGAATRHDSVR
jgi:hypothetical protein